MAVVYLGFSLFAHPQRIDGAWRAAIELFRIKLWHGPIQ